MGTEQAGKATSAASCPLVQFDSVGLRFRRHRSLLDMLRRRQRSNASEFWALKNVSFSIYEGETLGVIGRNGSGKSTLSLVCSRVYKPDRGSVSVNGRVQLLTLGLGFQQDLSGRENVYVSGTLLGMRKREIRARMGEIEDFADIGDFIDEPVRTYSSGMRGRLGFAIATAVRPEILILDEVMATGDKAFKEKAIARMKDLHAVAKCALIVSHSTGQVRQLCDRVMWLDRGRCVLQGGPAEVVPAYERFSKNPDAYRRANPEMFAMERQEGEGWVANIVSEKKNEHC